MTGKHDASEPASRRSGQSEQEVDDAGSEVSGAKADVPSGTSAHHGRSGAGDGGAETPEAPPRGAAGDASETDAPGDNGSRAGEDGEDGKDGDTGDGGARAGDAGNGGARDTGEADEGDPGDDLIDLSEIGAFLSESGGLKEIAAQRDEYLDSLRRLQADFDNYRKRAIRQQTELVERSTEGLLVRLLPVLDALDLAMAHLPVAGAGAGGESDAMRSLVQIGTLLRDVLAREGLERIDQVGVRFDPTIHDAVAEAGPAEPAEGAEGDAEGDAPAEGEGRGGSSSGPAYGKGAPGRADDNSVADVMRSGYRLKGRVLRPAMVAVRAGSGRAPGDGSGNDDN